MTALSGQTPKQLSHSKQLPHDRQRRASKQGGRPRSRPPTTSSKVRRRRAASRSGRTVVRRVGVVPGVEVLERGQLVTGRPIEARGRRARRRWPGPLACRARWRRSAVRAAGTCRRRRTRPAGPVIMSAPTCDDAVVDRDRRRSRPRSERSVSWPRARTSESAPSSSNSPVGCGKPSSSSSHPLDHEDARLRAPTTVESHLQPHALVDGVLRPRRRGPACAPGCAGRRRRRPRRRGGAPCGRRPWRCRRPP